MKGKTRYYVIMSLFILFSITIYTQTKSKSIINPQNPIIINDYYPIGNTITRKEKTSYTRIQTAVQNHILHTAFITYNLKHQVQNYAIIFYPNGNPIPKTIKVSTIDGDKKIINELHTKNSYQKVGNFITNKKKDEYTRVETSIQQGVFVTTHVTYNTDHSIKNASYTFYKGTRCLPDTVTASTYDENNKKMNNIIAFIDTACTAISQN